jgi:hypothetical protein
MVRKKCKRATFKDLFSPVGEKFCTTRAIRDAIEEHPDNFS